MNNQQKTEARNTMRELETFDTQDIRDRMSEDVDNYYIAQLLKEMESDGKVEKAGCKAGDIQIWRMK